MNLNQFLKKMIKWELCNETKIYFHRLLIIFLISFVIMGFINWSVSMIYYGNTGDLNYALFYQGCSILFSLIINIVLFIMVIYIIEISCIKKKTISKDIYIIGALLIMIFLHVLYLSYIDPGRDDGTRKWVGESESIFNIIPTLEAILYIFFPERPGKGMPTF